MSETDPFVIPESRMKDLAQGYAEVLIRAEVAERKVERLQSELAAEHDRWLKRGKRVGELEMELAAANDALYDALREKNGWHAKFDEASAGWAAANERAEKAEAERDMLAAAFVKRDGEWTTPTGEALRSTPEVKP